MSTIKLHENYSFETERLILRPIKITDATYVLELLNTPKWIKNIGDRNIQTLHDAEQYIESKMLTGFKKFGFGNYVIIRKNDGIIIGNCGLYNREGVDGVDVGYALLPKYEKKGYAFEAATKMLDAAKNHFKLTQVSGITIKENTASRKLLEKLGLQFKKIINIPNDDADLLLYSINFKNTNR